MPEDYVPRKPDTETRITDPKTGGQKGQKQAQLGALDPRALTMVARVAGFGAEKYARFNFARGYDWSLSYDALQRHLMAFWDGEDEDPESGLHHLGHAAWHCLALLTFALRKRGNDDRIHRFLAEVDEPDYARLLSDSSRCGTYDNWGEGTYQCTKPSGHIDRPHDMAPVDSVGGNR